MIIPINNNKLNNSKDNSKDKDNKTNKINKINLIHLLIYLIENFHLSGSKTLSFKSEDNFIVSIFP